MSKRLQVVLGDTEYRELERTARRRQTTVSSLVREALRDLQRSEPAGDPQRKLQIVREAVTHTYPAPAIGQMLEEIERGYIGREDE